MKGEERGARLCARAMAYVHHPRRRRRGGGTIPVAERRATQSTKTLRCAAVHGLEAHATDCGTGDPAQSPCYFWSFTHCSSNPPHADVSMRYT
jgi:hypothetical protein